MEKKHFERFCADGKIHWTTHGLKRIQTRDISREDVMNCIINGEIIEEYPDDYPYPSALIFGRKITGEIIHVVCGIDEEKIYFITAYEPTTEKFMEDLRTRRKK